MPQLSEQDFNRVLERVVSSAPQGLNEAQFNELLDRAVSEAEAAGDSPSVMSQSDWADSLPSAMGTAFSIAGGSKASPVGVGLAALGGALGEGGRQIVRSIQGRTKDVPDSVGGQLAEMAKAAGSQAVFEGGGRAAGAVLKPIGQTIYGLAMRPNLALRQEHGLVNLVKRGYADRIVPSGGGVEKAKRLVTQGADEATAMAAAKPIPLVLSRIVKRATDDQTARAAAEQASAGVTPPTAAIAKAANEVLSSNTPMVLPERLLELRRAADKVADPALAAARIPGGPRVPPGSEASIAKSFANEYRDVLRDTLGQRFEDVSKRTALRAGVGQMAKAAAERPNMLTNLLAAGVGGSALAGNGDLGDAAKKAALFRALFSPNVQAATAFGLPSLARQAVRLGDAASGGQIDQATRTALLQLLQGNGMEP